MTHPTPTPACEPPRGPLNVLQFLAFGLVGALGTGVHYGILMVAVSVLHLDPVIGTSAGACAGAVTNFVLNHRLTFRSRCNYTETAPRFFAIAALGLLLNAGIVYVFADRLSLHYLLAQLMATGSVLVINYVLNALWTFRTNDSGR